MSDGRLDGAFEADQLAMKEPESVSKSIDRHTTASILGVTDRTLLRWHKLGYGPKRQRDWARRVYYIQAEVDGWSWRMRSRPIRHTTIQGKTDVDCIEWTLSATGRCDPSGHPINGARR